MSAVASAPRTGYVYDEPVVVEPGGVIAIEAQVPCPYPYPQLIFSKLVVDSVKVAERAQDALVEIGRGQYSFSGGIARVTPAQSSTDDVYRSADLAAYRAKAAGGARTLLALETKAASES